MADHYELALTVSPEQLLQLVGLLVNVETHVQSGIESELFCITTPVGWNSQTSLTPASFRFGLLGSTDGVAIVYSRPGGQTGLDVTVPDNVWARKAWGLLLERLRRQKWVKQGSGETGRSEESGHYAYGPKKRLEIVKEFFQDRADGQVTNKDAWAQSKYNISGRTLSNYIGKFPIVEK
jgi:hypothetical protein